MTFLHTPVLKKQVIEALLLDRPQPLTIIDATLGLGGHTRAILETAGASVRVLAFEWDEKNRELAAANLKDFPQLEIVPASFSTMEAACAERGIASADAIVFDLGISSAHLDDAARGFSYRTEAPLDMRMNSNATLTASQLLHTLDEAELANLFFRYGEERRARQIAQKIVLRRKVAPLETTTDLYAIIQATCPQNPKKSASRVFQALRIMTNDELTEISAALPQALRLLAPGGRLAVISFHSLEDRIVKQVFRNAEVETRNMPHGWRRINKKVITPDDAETIDNPRARSAKLRVLERQ